MRGGTLENLSRAASDASGILRWAQAQLEIHRRATNTISLI